MHRRTHVLLGALFLLTLFAANAACEWPYAIRFSYAPLNYLGGVLLAVSVPISLALLAATVKGGLVRSAVLGGALLSLVLSTVFTFFVIFLTPIQLQDSLRIDGVTYRIYSHEPAGIGNQPSTFLRKEIDVGLGFRLVRTIWSSDVYGQARIRMMSSSAIEVEIDGDFFRQRVEI